MGINELNDAWIAKGQAVSDLNAQLNTAVLDDNFSADKFAEQNKPEYVIPTDINKRSRAYQLLGEVIARFRGEEPSVQTTRDDQSIDKDNFRSLESKLDQLHKDIQSLINLGTQQVAAIHSQGKFDPKRQDILQAQRLSMKLNSF